MIGETLSDLGACLTELRQYAEAERLLTEAWELLSTTREPTDSRVVRARERLAELYRRTGQGARAAQLPS